IVFLSPTSVTIEMVNKSPYFSETPFDVYLNDKLVLSNVKTNVFSLYHLERNTEYKIKVEKETLKFRTLDYKYKIDVCEYGAIPDGVFDNTKVLQTIILGAPKETLIYFKPGVYFTGPLFLKNDLMIELDKDAVLLGKTDRKEYPILKARVERNDGSILEQSSWEGTPADTFASIITGVEVSNVKIFGEGIIDCNAQNSDWWINHKQMRGGAWRPKGIFLSNSQHIGLQG